MLHAGTIDKLASGTVDTVSMLSAGTVTTVAMVQAGTLDMLKAGTVNIQCGGTTPITQANRLSFNLGAQTTAGDALANTSHIVGLATNDNSGALAVMPYSFNGSTWDRIRGGTYGINVEQQYSGTHISAAGTTAGIKTAAGMLHLITFNTANLGTFTIVDGTTATSGVTIAIIANNGTLPFSLGYNCKLVNGLSVINAGTADVTIMYR